MKKFILIGVAVFLISILLSIPASIASKLLPSHINADQLSGNIWNGSAATLIVDQSNFGSVKWKIKPSCFLVLKLCADIKQSNNEISSTFLLKLRNTTVLENVAASGDARILNSILKKHGLTLAGDFVADFNLLSISDNRIENIDGEIKFRELAINGVLRVLLGELNSQFEPKEEHTLIHISNDRGHVDISGQAQLFKDMSFDLDMNIKQNPNSSDAVVNGMQFIGDKQSDGSVRLQHNGKLAI